MQCSFFDGLCNNTDGFFARYIVLRLCRKGQTHNRKRVCFAQVIPSITFWSTLSPIPTSKGDAVGSATETGRNEARESEGTEKKASGSETTSPAISRSGTVFQFPTVVNGQMMFAGVPVRPIAAALGQPIPADQVSSVASQLTSHMSTVASPLTLLSPNSLATLTTSWRHLTKHGGVGRFPSVAFGAAGTMLSAPRFSTVPLVTVDFLRRISAASPTSADESVYVLCSTWRIVVCQNIRAVAVAEQPYVVACKNTRISSVLLTAFKRICRWTSVCKTLTDYMKSAICFSSWGNAVHTLKRLRGRFEVYDMSTARWNSVFDYRNIIMNWFSGPVSPFCMCMNFPQLFFLILLTKPIPVRVRYCLNCFSNADLYGATL